MSRCTARHGSHALMFTIQEVDAAKRIERTLTESIRDVYHSEDDDCKKFPDLWANARYRDDVLVLGAAVLDMIANEGE